jgi:hypothetical protein
MNPTPTCGHAECAGGDFCGFTGQRIRAQPGSAPPPQSSAGTPKWIWLAVGGGAFAMLLLGLGWWFLFGGLRGSVADMVREPRPKFPYSDTDIRIPGMLAALPVRAVYVPAGRFDELGVEATVGRLLTAADEGAIPTRAVLREEYAELVTRGMRDLKSAGPEYAGRAVPNPEDFISIEIEIGGRKAVVVGIAGTRPVRRGTLRGGFSGETAVVYLPSSGR